MKKDKVIENETKEKETLNTEVTEEISSEVEKLSTNEDDLDLKENSGTGKEIFSNILDQLILAAISSVLVVIIDFALNAVGYRFVRDNGAVVGAGAIIYFIFNCIYTPLMAKTKEKKTIAKRILSI